MSPGLGAALCHCPVRFLLLTAHPLVITARKPAISEGDDPRQYTVEMVVEPSSTLAGKTVEQAGLRHLPGLYLVEIQRGAALLTAISPREVLRERDQLVFVGAVTSIVDLTPNSRAQACNRSGSLSSIRPAVIAPLIEAVVL